MADDPIVAALTHWAAAILGAENVFRPGHGEEFVLAALKEQTDAI